MTGRLREGIVLYQWLAGLCDTTTGFLLIGAPAFTLHMMGLSIIPSPVAFVRYIGVFVFSVGLTYMWIVLRFPLHPRATPVWSTQWKVTALIRLLVAVFVVWQVASGGVEVRWMSVAFSDGLFAVIQIIGLRKGWLNLAG